VHSVLEILVPGLFNYVTLQITCDDGNLVLTDGSNFDYYIDLQYAQQACTPCRYFCHKLVNSRSGGALAYIGGPFKKLDVPH